MGLKPLELKKIAETRLRDSEILFDGNRYDGTIYLSGYVIELALKATIAKEQNTDFPETPDEFRQLNTNMVAKLSPLQKKTVRIHELRDLVRLTDFINVIGNDVNIGAYWDMVVTWNPEIRYARIGATHAEAEQQLEAVRELWKKLSIVN